MRTVVLFLAVVGAFFCMSSVSAQTPDMAGDQQRFDQGAAAYDAGNYEQAYTIFLDLAEHNDIAAMRNVALMKRKGQGTEKDPEGARDYLQQASDAGLPTAQYDLAQMLLNGEGGDPDPKAAVPLLKRAAAGHHPLAEFELGQMYEVGNVVPKDIAKAESLYEDAAAAGMKEAASRLSAVKAMPAGGSEVAPAKSDPGPASGATQDTSSPDSATATMMPTEAKARLAGGFVLQIGAYKSEAEAMDSWRAYKAAHVAAAEFAPDIEQADLPGKGTWYRLQIGPFAGVADARALCSKLKASGGACFPRKTMSAGP